jgi:hypothetical protein
MRTSVLLLSAIVCWTLTASVTGKKDVSRTRKATSVGHRFPNFEGTTLWGQQFDHTRFKGRVTLVHVWKLDCHWSMKGIPEYSAIVDSISDPRFQMISMAPQTRVDLRRFYGPDSIASVPSVHRSTSSLIPHYDVLPMCTPLRKQPAYGPQDDCSTLEDLLGVIGYPVVLIVGPDGVIRYREEGFPINATSLEPDMRLFKIELDSMLKVL